MTQYVYNFPDEIFDNIIYHTNKLELAVKFSSYTAWQIYNPRIHTWEWATKNNLLYVLKWFYKTKVSTHTERIAEIAVGYGYFAIIKWLHKINADFTIDVLDTAAKSGNIELVEWLFKNRTEGCSYYAIDKAAGYGHLDMVKLLHKKYYIKCSSNAIYNACENGHFEVVKWLYEHDHVHSECAMEISINKGYIEIFKWLYARNYKPTEYTLNYAAMGNDLDNVRYLCEELKLECTEDTLFYIEEYNILEYLCKKFPEKITDKIVNIIASRGYLELLNWIMENHKKEITNNAIDHAVYNKKYDIVKYLYKEYNLRCTIQSIYNITWHKDTDIEMLKWILDNNQITFIQNSDQEQNDNQEQNDEDSNNNHIVQDIISNAVYNNNIEFLKLLHNTINDCRFCGDMMYIAVNNCYFTIIDWLEQNCNYIHNNEQKTEILGAAAKNGKLEVLKYFYNKYDTEFRNKNQDINILDISEVIAEAASKGHFEIIKWLHNLGYKGNLNAMIYAAENSNLKMVEWLYKNDYHYGNIEENAIKSAIGVGNIDIMIYLCEIYKSELPKDIIIGAMKETASYGALTMMKWFYNNGYEHLFEEDCVDEMLRGSILERCYDVMKWLCENCNRCTNDELLYEVLTTSIEEKYNLIQDYLISIIGVYV